MADIEFDDFDGGGAGGRSDVPLLNWAGAVLSVGLIAGLAIWGYKLTVRDVAGVPVVRAIEGPMRIQPEDPGGQLATHQGLAVNQVQAAGAAEPAAERLILAPEPIALIDSDTPVAVVQAATPVLPTPELQTIVPDRPVASPNSAIASSEPSPDNFDTLVQQVALDVAKSQGLPADTPNEATNGPQILSASVPGIKSSLRPSPRPAAALLLQAKAQAQSVTTASTGTIPEIEAATIAVGTRLVQLGAFDSAEIARSEWGRLNKDFSEYFTDKTRVVQRAESGGRVFYRLRAVGFADLSDARRFCSVLLAKDAACIPVVVR